MVARLEVLHARIETLAVDAVVNAANTALLPGAGVDGALRRAAGPELTARTATMKPLSEGEAVATSGFAAPARHIIHTAAPIWFIAGDDVDKIARLSECYRNCIMLAHDMGLRSIAFPCLGTGNFGWPREIARDTALASVRAALPAAPAMEQIIFCCFTDADAALYRAAL